MKPPAIASMIIIGSIIDITGMNHVAITISKG
jgi:hypothetical protein